MRRLAKKQVLAAARSMRRTTPHVASEPHKVSEGSRPVTVVAPAVLTASELADIEGTLTAAKELLEKLDTSMRGPGAQVIDPHSPLDRVYQGIFRGLMLMQVGRVRLGVTK
jgi:hypothetical protein